MPRTRTEVIVGPGTLYIAPVGTAFPADPAVTPAGTWADIGYSEEGWEFAIDTTVENLEVEEERSPIDRLRSAEEVRMRGASAQATLENLQLALGGGTITTSAGPPATKSLTPPAGAGFSEKALLYRALGPVVTGVQKYRDIKMPRVMASGAVAMRMRKGAANKTVIAQDYLALKPDTGDTWSITELT